MVERWLLAAALFLAAGPAFPDCIDINADPMERLTTIVHIDDEHTAAIIASRPWSGVLALTRIRGIGRGRIRDIAAEGLAYVDVRASVGAREAIRGVATVLDADTLEVADETIRLIGIKALEGDQLC